MTASTWDWLVEALGAVEWASHRALHWFLWIFLLAAAYIFLARTLRNRRLPAQLRELARRLGAPRPSWWACVHRPRIRGHYDGAELFVDFLAQDPDSTLASAYGEIWIDVHMQAPPDLSGHLHYRDYEALAQLARDCTPEEADALRTSADWLWGCRQTTPLRYALGWARIHVAGRWDAADLTPDRMMRLIEATRTLLVLTARVERRRALAAPACARGAAA
jgi:hypothetical protein